MRIFLLILRIVLAVIFVQTLLFKFGGHPDSIYIFSKIGVEPYGRIGLGVLELITAILLLFPRTVWIGSVLALGIVGGAIIMHLTILGIEIRDDGGKLFFIAIFSFILSLLVLYFYRKQIPFFSKK